jgi:hypothetical protein
MAILGSTAKQGVGVEYNISFDGANQTWGTDVMVSVSSSRYEAESRDSKLNVPSFRASLYDPTGAIWNALGDGTTAFNKDIVVGVKIGGTYDYVEDPLGTFFEKTSTTGADEYTLHTGKIKRVSKKDRKVSFESRNNMHFIKELKWQMPISDTSINRGNTIGGTRTQVAAIATEAKFNNVTTEEASIGTNKGKVVGYVSKELLLPTNYLGTGILTSDITADVASGFRFLDTAFRNESELVEFDYTEIEGVGTFVDWPDKVDEDITRFYWVQAEMGLKGDPVNMLRHFIGGKFVSDFFLDANDIHDSSFVSSAKNYAFNTFSGTLHSKNAEGEVLFSDIQDIITSTAALFFVDETNKINIVTYGPNDLQQTLDVFTGTDLTDVSLSNEIEDSYNKVTIKYAYSNDSNKFTKTRNIADESWSGTDNRELLVESKWMTSNVEAEVMNERLFNRHKDTTPRIKFKTSLGKIGKGISDLIRLTDSDSGLNEKIIQITSYNADVINNKEVTYSGIDGESLFLRNGYAHWEDDSDTNGTWWGTMVTNTHTSGWADGGVQSGIPNGKVLNIGTDLYGTAFKWW